MTQEEKLASIATKAAFDFSVSGLVLVREFGTGLSRRLGRPYDNEDYGLHFMVDRTLFDRLVGEWDPIEGAPAGSYSALKKMIPVERMLVDISTVRNLFLGSLLGLVVQNSYRRGEGEEP